MRTQAIRPHRVHDFVSSIFDYDLHAKRVASLANATVGALQGARLAVGAIGRALAVAKDLDPKHAIKQVDRFFSNTGVDVWALFASWVPYVVGSRSEILVAIDWTDYDPDNQSTMAIYLVTKHGRATPLIWKTVKKSTLQGWRNEYEDQVLERLHEVLPAGVKVTVLADRGFGDQKFYELLKDQLGFDFVVRFRGVIKVTSAEGETKSALAWTPNNGRSLLLRGARVTREGRQLGAVVCLKAKGMKDAWHLATSFGDKPAAEIVNLYSRRFTIEESFRDMKNLRFGMGLSDTRIGSPERRDRILLVGAVAAALLTLLGAAGEAVGLDRRMKANTSKERTHSLLNQGLFYFDWLLTMRDERALPLMQAFDELVRNQATFREMLGVI
ncbi:MAG TPA: IS4 family transposase [Gemmatimonadaceae bacterium]|nr:IS4 family transposase [Gemmatimonadaceae bacterium]